MNDQHAQNDFKCMLSIHLILEAHAEHALHNFRPMAGHALNDLKCMLSMLLIILKGQ